MEQPADKVSESHVAAYEHAEDWKKLSDVINAFFNSHALFSACELGLFAHLREHPGGALQEVAAGLQLGQYAARILLLAVCNTGLIEKRGTRYFNSSAAEHFLTAAPDSLLPWIRYMSLISSHSIAHLTQSLRAGKNCGSDFVAAAQAQSIYGRFDENAEYGGLFNDAMKSLSRHLVRPLLSITEFEQVSHLIDVGGGGAEVAVQLCRRFPQLEVTILDNTTTCSLARTHVACQGLGDRIGCEALDVLRQERWTRRDSASILMSHFISFFDPDDICKLYGIAKRQMKPGDRLFVWDTMANDEESGGMTASRLSIYFLNTATGHGMAYPAAEHVRILEELGFRIERICRVDAIEHGLIIAVPV